MVVVKLHVAVIRDRWWWRLGFEIAIILMVFYSDHVNIYCSDPIGVVSRSWRVNERKNT